MVYLYLPDHTLTLHTLIPTDKTVAKTEDEDQKESKDTQISTVRKKTKKLNDRVDTLVVTDKDDE